MPGNPTSKIGKRLQKVQAQASIMPAANPEANFVKQAPEQLPEGPPVPPAHMGHSGPSESFNMMDDPDFAAGNPQVYQQPAQEPVLQHSVAEQPVQASGAGQASAIPVQPSAEKKAKVLAQRDTGSGPLGYEGVQIAMEMGIARGEMYDSARYLRPESYEEAQTGREAALKALGQQREQLIASPVGGAALQRRRQAVVAKAEQRTAGRQKPIFDQMAMHDVADDPVQAPADAVAASSTEQKAERMRQANARSEAKFGAPGSAGFDQAASDAEFRRKELAFQAPDIAPDPDDPKYLSNGSAAYFRALHADQLAYGARQDRLERTGVSRASDEDRQTAGRRAAENSVRALRTAQGKPADPLSLKSGDKSGTKQRFSSSIPVEPIVVEEEAANQEMQSDAARQDFARRAAKMNQKDWDKMFEAGLSAKPEADDDVEPVPDPGSKKRRLPFLPDKGSMDEQAWLREAGKDTKGGYFPTGLPQGGFAALLLGNHFTKEGEQGTAPQTRDRETSRSSTQSGLQQLILPSDYFDSSGSGASGAGGSDAMLDQVRAAETSANDAASLKLALEQTKALAGGSGSRQGDLPVVEEDYNDDPELLYGSRPAEEYTDRPLNTGKRNEAADRRANYEEKSKFGQWEHLQGLPEEDREAFRAMRMHVADLGVGEDQRRAEEQSLKRAKQEALAARRAANREKARQRFAISGDDINARIADNFGEELAPKWTARDKYINPQPPAMRVQDHQPYQGQEDGFDIGPDGGSFDDITAPEPSSGGTGAPVSADGVTAEDVQDATFAEDPNAVQAGARSGAFERLVQRKYPQNPRNPNARSPEEFDDFVASWSADSQERRAGGIQDQMAAKALAKREARAAAAAKRPGVFSRLFSGLGSALGEFGFGKLFGRSRGAGAQPPAAASAQEAPRSKTWMERFFGARRPQRPAAAAERSAKDDLADPAMNGKLLQSDPSYFGHVPLPIATDDVNRGHFYGREWNGDEEQALMAKAGGGAEDSTLSAEMDTFNISAKSRRQALRMAGAHRNIQADLRQAAETRSKDDSEDYINDASNLPQWRMAKLAEQMRGRGDFQPPTRQQYPMQIAYTRAMQMHEARVNAAVQAEGIKRGIIRAPEPPAEQGSEQEAGAAKVDAVPSVDVREAPVEVPKVDAEAERQEMAARNAQAEERSQMAKRHEASQKGLNEWQAAMVRPASDASKVRSQPAPEVPKPLTKEEYLAREAREAEERRRQEEYAKSPEGKVEQKARQKAFKQHLKDLRGESTSDKALGALAGLFNGGSGSGGGAGESEALPEGGAGVGGAGPVLGGSGGGAGGSRAVNSPMFTFNEGQDEVAGGISMQAIENYVDSVQAPGQVPGGGPGGASGGASALIEEHNAPSVESDVVQPVPKGVINLPKNGGKKAKLVGPQPTKAQQAEGRRLLRANQQKIDENTANNKKLIYKAKKAVNLVQDQRVDPELVGLSEREAAEHVMRADQAHEARVGKKKGFFSKMFS